MNHNEHVGYDTSNAADFDLKTHAAKLAQAVDAMGQRMGLKSTPSTPKKEDTPKSTLQSVKHPSTVPGLPVGKADKIDKLDADHEVQSNVLNHTKLQNHMGSATSAGKR